MLNKVIDIEIFNRNTILEIQIKLNRKNMKEDRFSIWTEEGNISNWNDVKMEDIENNIKTWATENLGSKFEFREHQLETIRDIIYNSLVAGKFANIVQAPTGSGKSLINIISAEVLYNYYGMTSYILASDLFLYSQYEEFVKQYDLRDIGFLKGQTGNYACPKDGKDVRCAQCKLRSYTYWQLYWGSNDILGAINNYNKGIGKEGVCGSADKCQYIQERYEAERSPICIMTYELFYFQMNIIKEPYVESHIKVAVSGFAHKNFLFMDECHNIPNIMQNRCRPVIKKEDLTKLRDIYNFYKHYTSKHRNTNKLLLAIPSDEEINKRFNLYWEQMLDKELDSYNNTILLLNYTKKLVNLIYACGDRSQAWLKSKLVQGLNLSEREWKAHYDIAWLQNYHCFLDDFARAIEITGFIYTVKQIQGNTITFSCVKEDGIISQFLLKHAERCVFTSATVGNIETFVKNCGITHLCDEDDIAIYDIPSNFDFSKSPIYIFDKYKMNFANKAKNAPILAEFVENIVNKYENKNGLIQTGSYENAKNLYKQLPSEIQNRCLLYTNSAQKREFIGKIKKNTNYILIGPSLNEGIDLPGELCKFIIVLKIPYLSMADKYVQKKMRMFRGWYTSVAANNLIQGIGRGNRYINDQCDTYILDGCFNRLYKLTKKQFPNYVSNRFLKIGENFLIKNYVAKKAA